MRCDEGVGGVMREWSGDEGVGGVMREWEG